jgi:hypothetical protein
LPLPDDSADKWVYKEHTKVKHEILSKYLNGWVKILGKRNKKLCFIDGFAGRGIYENGEPGSPIIIMQLAEELKEYCDEFICVNVELDRNNFNCLKTETEKAQVKCPFPKIINIHGEFANVTTHILNQLNDELIPSFFFVDPFGFGGIPFSLIKRILNIPKTEIFFTSLEELFGVSNVLEIISSKYPDMKREMALVSLYRDNLKTMAGVQYTMPYKINMTESRQTLYYLIHASNHFKAFKLMKDIMYGESKTGIFSYLGPEECGGIQSKLFDFNNSEFESYLLRRFSGRQITFNKVLEETYQEVGFIEKHYRNSLKDLETQGKISIQRIASKKHGLKDNDLITFPKYIQLSTR